MPKRRLLTLEELELTPREIATIKFLVRWRKEHRFPTSPSHRELLEHLNKVLPKQPDGGPALVSLEQTRRIADQLRMKGVLVSSEEFFHMPRNLVLTVFGEQAAAKYKQ